MLRESIIDSIRVIDKKPREVRNFIEENKKLTEKIELYRKRIRIKKDFKKDILNRHLKRKSQETFIQNRIDNIIDNQSFEIAKTDLQEISLIEEKSIQTILKTEDTENPEIENSQIDEPLLEEKQVKNQEQQLNEEELEDKKLEDEEQQNLNQKFAGIDQVYNDIGRHLSDLKEFLETGHISKRSKRLKEIEKREERDLFNEAFSRIFRSSVQPDDFKFFRKDEDEDDLARLLDQNKPNEELRVLYKRDSF